MYIFKPFVSQRAIVIHILFYQRKQKTTQFKMFKFTILFVSVFLVVMVNAFPTKDEMEISVDCVAIIHSKKKYGNISSIYGENTLWYHLQNRNIVPFSRNIFQFFKSILQYRPILCNENRKIWMQNYFINLEFSYSGLIEPFSSFL